MSGINDVSQSDCCVLNGWVCRSQPGFVLWACVCVCMQVFLFPVVFYLCCRISWDVSLLFCPPVLWSARMWIQDQERCYFFFLFFSWACTWFPEKWPDHTNSKLHQPSFHKKPYQLCRRCLLSEVTANAMLQFSDHPIRPVCFRHPHFSLGFSSFSICLSRPPMKERNICSCPKGDTLNTGSF